MEKKEAAISVALTVGSLWCLHNKYCFPSSGHVQDSTIGSQPAQNIRRSISQE